MTDFTKDTKHMKTTETNTKTKTVLMVHKNDNNNYNNATKEEIIFYNKSKYPNDYDSNFSDNDCDAIINKLSLLFSPTSYQTQIDQITHVFYKDIDAYYTSNDYNKHWYRTEILARL